MIIINLKDLIQVMPDLINLFLSGFIFMVTYNWINHRETNVSLLVLWSLFISVLVKSLCSIIHTLIFINLKFSDPAKILIYSFLGLLLAILITWIRNTELLKRVLYRVNNKSVNDDIFDDIIDYNKRTMMMIYLKSSPIVYIGRFLYREENGLDSWIALVDYDCLKTDDAESIFNPKEVNILSTVVINLRDVERIQLQYEKDSDTWKRFCKDENNDKGNKETSN